MNGLVCKHDGLRGHTRVERGDALEAGSHVAKAIIAPAIHHISTVRFSSRISPGVAKRRCPAVVGIKREGVVTARAARARFGGTKALGGGAEAGRRAEAI